MGGAKQKGTTEDLTPDYLIIGLGSEHRRDDRCGLDVVRGLRGRVDRSVRLLEGPADATALLDSWEHVDRVIVVDAVRSGGPPGTVFRIEVDGELPSPLGAISTHGLSLADAVELGRSLGRMPRRLTIYGIEVGDLALGEELSPAVRAAVGHVRGQLEDELRSSLAASHPGG